MRVFFLMLFSVVGLAGCAQYNVAGQFENDGQPFVGTVKVSVGNAGTIDISSLDGRFHCSGTSQVTKQPSGYTAIGAQGRAEATCNDGRAFKVDFIQSTESGGSGQGIDSNGNIVSLFFDESAGLAQSMLKQQRLNSLIK